MNNRADYEDYCRRMPEDITGYLAQLRQEWRQREQADGAVPRCGDDADAEPALRQLEYLIRLCISICDTASALDERQCEGILNTVQRKVCKSLETFRGTAIVTFCNWTAIITRKEALQRIARQQQRHLPISLEEHAIDGFTPAFDTDEWLTAVLFSQFLRTCSPAEQELLHACLEECPMNKLEKRFHRDHRTIRDLIEPLLKRWRRFSEGEPPPSHQPDVNDPSMPQQSSSNERQTKRRARAKKGEQS